MFELITPIPGTTKRVKTTQWSDGRYCISLQQNAENLINPFPWEIDEDGWRTCKSETTSDQIEAYHLHDRYIGAEIRRMMAE